MRKFIRFMFVPRTDSPTIAYYAGLFSGIALTIQVAQIAAAILEARELEEAFTQDELDAMNDA